MHGAYVHVVPWRLGVVRFVRLTYLHVGFVGGGKEGGRGGRFTRERYCRERYGFRLR